jgi:Zn-dependent protease with chaperone function
MNFFDQQDRARQNTRSLIIFFSLAVLTMMAGIYFASLTALKASPMRDMFQIRCVSVYSAPEPTLTYVKSKNRSSFSRSSSSSSYSTRRYHTSSSSTASCNTNTWWYPQLFFWVALGTTTIVGGGSWYKINQLKEGGAAIAQELGGRLLRLETATAEEAQLMNIVEEMAIASGISVPAVYLLDQEPNINAFAAGYTPNDAVIGVTRGSVEQLTRDELQGVIAHEFSHILNGDMRMNIKLMGVLHGILFIYLAGRILAEARDHRSNPLSNFGFALILVGCIGLFFGRLIKSAVSRQREFLADASAVQFTRNPDGISGALEKLAGMGSKLESPRAEASSHMFFGSALNFDFLDGIFATHPPLLKRIEKIKGKSYVAGKTEPAQSFSESAAIGFAGQQVVETVGTVAPEHYTFAKGLIAELPDLLKTSIRERRGAIATVYALLLEPEPTQQLDFLGQVEEKDIVEQTLALIPVIKQLEARSRLPVLDLTIPVLRQGSDEDNKRLLKCVMGISKADGKWTMAEFVVFLVLQHRLNLSGEQSVQFHAIAPVWSDCLNLLSALARVGETQADAIQYAFRSGVYRLPGSSLQEIPEIPPTCNLGDLRKSLDRLRSAAPKVKQAIVDACAHTVMLDNKITTQEAELLRAIVITLDCPIPPFLERSR